MQTLTETEKGVIANALTNSTDDFPRDVVEQPPRMNRHQRRKLEAQQRSIAKYFKKLSNLAPKE